MIEPGVVLIAIGGNALVHEGESGALCRQQERSAGFARQVVDLVAAGWRVLVTHGNGPQVGDELVRNELARYNAPPLPLGVLVAATAGWIGYMVQQSLENALRRLQSPRARYRHRRLGGKPFCWSRMNRACGRLRGPSSSGTDIASSKRNRVSKPSRRSPGTTARSICC